jgi:hypothetical protein
MSAHSTNVEAGFPEMWQLVHDKYELFFEAAEKLQPIVNEMIGRPLEGQLLQMIGRMALAAVNTYGALLTLVMNGYGHDAMKLARSLFETELNILWLKKHPEDVRDFLDFNVIQQKQLYDELSEEQRKQVEQESYAQMIDAYNKILPRFRSRQDKDRPRNEWCRESLYKRAKEAGPLYLDLYQKFYRQASSMHHGDIGGLIFQSDENMKIELAPSWNLLEDALIASGMALRCVGYFDEIAKLGFRERLESGPNEAYIAAMESLTQ